MRATMDEDVARVYRVFVCVASQRRTKRVLRSIVVWRLPMSVPVLVNGLLKGL